jgi:hypothetical protein
MKILAYGVTPLAIATLTDVFICDARKDGDFAWESFG